MESLIAKELEVIQQIYNRYSTNLRSDDARSGALLGEVV
jgi:hypothetical protein